MELCLSAAARAWAFRCASLGPLSAARAADVEMMFQRVHPGLWAAAPFLCHESEPSIFRSPRDGQRNWIGLSVAELTIPIDPATQKPLAAERIELSKQLGKNFSAKSDCIADGC